ncbi:MAG: aldo/keto reductase [Gammaproteobacteria bacterium]
MRYLKLGRSGLKVSELCLGAMTFGEEFGIGADAKESRRVFDTYGEAGGNFIDTADIYNRGTSERMLGEFIASQRDDFIIASKYSLTTQPENPNAGGNHRKNLVVSLENSLRRLNTDCIDLYWIHGWDQSTPVADVMRALDDQVRAGKILHVGISNAPAWWVAAANTLADERNMTAFTALQLHYNLVERSIEADFNQLADAQDMRITAWSPLAGGLLTGKYDPDSNEDARSGARLADSPMGARTLSEINLEAAQGLSAIAAQVGASAAQVALAWVLQRRAPATIPIIGARKLSQLQDNLAATQVQLDEDIIARLDALKPPPDRYPSALLRSEFFHTMMLGEHRADLLSSN